MLPAAVGDKVFLLLWHHEARLCAPAEGSDRWTAWHSDSGDAAVAFESILLS